MDTATKNDRHNMDPETLQDLQACLYDWQNYNFGEDQDNELILLGICEEAGELCHAQLKLEQNIRGDAKKHEEEMIDAIGDMMIYSMNYLSGMNSKIASFTPREDVEPAGPEEHHKVRSAVNTVFRLAGRLVEKPTDPNGVRQIVHQLVYLCALKNWSLEKIARLTWKVVAQRDWKQYPETGLPPQQQQPAAAAG
ncbi:MAG: nucleoside triphosphate pyrophosphohydrolase family protein [Planctomycetota bacterium]|jgi:NTP pyrophosphatase (non-canonical NTP hydrolase)